MFGIAILLGIGIIVALLLLCLLDVGLDYLFEEYPFLGVLVSFILFIVALWGVIEVLSL